MKFAKRHLRIRRRWLRIRRSLKMRVWEWQKDVKEKLKAMKPDGINECMKLAMLYFLPTITKIRSKVGCPIEPFILQAVDDMDLCKTFPWVCFTFVDCIKEIFHLKDHFIDRISNKMSWTFPGFINVGGKSVEVFKIKFVII